MEIKGVTKEEARAVQQFLDNVPFQTQGTVPAQYQVLSLLVAFQAKLAVAIKEEEESDDQTRGPRPGE